MTPAQFAKAFHLTQQRGSNSGDFNEAARAVLIQLGLPLVWEEPLAQLAEFGYCEMNEWAEEQLPSLKGTIS